MLPVVPKVSRDAAPHAHRPAAPSANKVPAAAGSAVAAGSDKTFNAKQPVYVGDRVRVHEKDVISKSSSNARRDGSLTGEALYVGTAQVRRLM